MLSRIIRATQYRQEDKLRELFAEQNREMAQQLQEAERIRARELATTETQTASVEASAILENAKLEAEQFLLQAEAGRQQALEEGYKEGYEKGVEEGFHAGIQQLIAEMGKMFRNLERELENAQMGLNVWIEHMPQQVIQLSAQIAEKIVRREIQLHPEQIVEQVEIILRQLARVKTLAIRVNPSDFPMVRAYEEQFIALTQGIDSIEFVIDHSLEPGGCIIETDSGGFDASVAAQLARIEAALMEGNRDPHA